MENIVDNTEQMHEMVGYLFRGNISRYGKRFLNSVQKRQCLVAERTSRVLHDALVMVKVLTDDSL